MKDKFTPGEMYKWSDGAVGLREEYGGLLLCLEPCEDDEDEKTAPAWRFGLPHQYVEVRWWFWSFKGRKKLQLYGDTLVRADG
jgi:hypothetical protein